MVKKANANAAVQARVGHIADLPANRNRRLIFSSKM